MRAAGTAEPNPPPGTPSPEPRRRLWFGRLSPQLSLTVNRRLSSAFGGQGIEGTRASDSRGPERLVVVGHGMVAQRFCERVVELGLLRSHRLTVFGEEPVPAYDRVQLGSTLGDGAVERLTLQDRDWFERHGILLRTHARVTRISRDERTIETDRGDFVSYDKLVLATGSSAIRPKGVPTNSQRTRVYRTAQDLQWIRKQAAAAKRAHGPALIIGAGLLGLELAEALTTSGLDVMVIEAGQHLLPRQLDEQTAAYIARRWCPNNVTLRFGTRLDHLSEDESSLTAHLDDGTRVNAAFAVFAIGIRPRDDLAREAELQCDLFGGIEINDVLETSDSRIYAIGECARFRGMTYGLVAPGYEMANVLAERLAGKSSVFEQAAMATRLKSSRVQVSVFGQSAVNDPLTPPLLRVSESCWRRLILERGKIVGATVVGEWEELPALQQVFARRSTFKARQRKRFLDGKNVWGACTVDLRTWPNDAIVCTCTGVTCKALRQAHDNDCKTIEALKTRTGAGSVCGSCQPLISSLVHGPVASATSSGATLIWTAAVALLLCVATLLAAPTPLASSVQGAPYDLLWRDGTAKQVSGFSLLALFLATGLGFSLRKRWQRLTWGNFSGWRVAHVGLGLSCLVGAWIHTGFRLGENLDLALMLCFLATSTLGAVASCVVGLERSLGARSAMAYRRLSTRLHVYLLWPVPGLLLFHVIKVYYF